VSGAGTWLLAGLLLGGATVVLPAESEVAATVLEFVQRERERTGAPRLARRDDLDRVAAARIGAPEGPLRPLLEAEGVGGYRAVYEYRDVRRAHNRGQAMARLWRSQPEAWGRAMSPQTDSIGLATTRTEDHWLVLVAVLLEEPRPREVSTLTRDLLERVNALRAEHGAPVLAAEGATVGETRSKAVLRARYRGPGDAVGHAVEIWSRDPLRADLLDPAYTRATVETTVDADDDEVVFVLVLIQTRE